MKKTLLFSLFLTFALTACGANPGGDVEPADTGTPSELQILIGEAKTELDTRCKEASNATKSKSLIGLIQFFEDTEMSFLDGIEDEDEASGAIDIINEHENEFVQECFMSTAFGEVATYVYDTMENISYLDIKFGVYETYDCFRGTRDSFEDFTFMAVIELTNEMYDAINEYLVTHGYYNFEEFGWVVDDTYSYGMDLANEYREYLDIPEIEEKVREIIKVFEGVTTEAEALELAPGLKSEIFSYILGKYKEGLIGAYNNFINDLRANISNQEIEDYVTQWVEDDCAAIGGESSFELALKCYSASIDIIYNEASTKIRNWADAEIKTLYAQARDKIEDTEYEVIIYGEYIRALTIVDNYTGDLMDYEREAMQAIHDLDRNIKEALRNLE